MEKRASVLDCASPLALWLRADKSLVLNENST
jgi:hypothetical protein